MRARILLPGGDYKDVTGRTAESIARTHYGRDAQVRQEHSDLINPSGTRWTVTRWVEAVNAHSVIGTIITWPTRPGPGRPQKHGEPMVRVPLRLPESVHAEVAATATEAGRSVNDELVTRVTRPSPSPRQARGGLNGGPR
jgi:Arc-like DNA binding domain